MEVPIESQDELDYAGSLAALQELVGRNVELRVDGPGIGTIAKARGELSFDYDIAALRWPSGDVVDLTEGNERRDAVTFTVGEKAQFTLHRRKFEAAWRQRIRYDAIEPTGRLWVAVGVNLTGGMTVFIDEDPLASSLS